MLKLNFSTTVFGATFLCTTVFRADTGNKKTANFTYSYLYARPVKELLIRKHVRAKQPKFSGALSWTPLGAFWADPWGAFRVGPQPPASKLRNSQFGPDGPNWKFLSHTLDKDLNYVILFWNWTILLANFLRSINLFKLTK